MQEHGSANDVGHLALSSLSDIIAHSMVDHLVVAVCVFDRVAIGILFWALDFVFIEPLDGVDVGEAQEWTRGGFERGVQLLDQSCCCGSGEKNVDGVADLCGWYEIKLTIWLQRRLTTASMWLIRSSNVMNASSPSKWVYSARCLRVWLQTHGSIAYWYM